MVFPKFTHYRLPPAGFAKVLYLAFQWLRVEGGGILSVSVSAATSTGDGVVLTVEDDGLGIAPKDLPKVFDAFFTTRATVGTGIGLFVAKQFVEGHGGRIAIESSCEPDRHGTTVRVFIPLHTACE
jgi:signal transduction histidine kinase